MLLKNTQCWWWRIGKEKIILNLLQKQKGVNILPVSGVEYKDIIEFGDINPCWHIHIYSVYPFPLEWVWTICRLPPVQVKLRVHITKLYAKFNNSEHHKFSQKKKKGIYFQWATSETFSIDSGIWLVVKKELKIFLHEKK